MSAAVRVTGSNVRIRTSRPGRSFLRAVSVIGGVEDGVFRQSRPQRLLPRGRLLDREEVLGRPQALEADAVVVPGVQVCAERWRKRPAPPWRSG